MASDAAEQPPAADSQGLADQLAESIAARQAREARIAADLVRVCRFMHRCAASPPTNATQAEGVLDLILRQDNYPNLDGVFVHVNIGRQLLVMQQEHEQKGKGGSFFGLLSQKYRRKVSWFQRHLRVARLCDAHPCMAYLPEAADVLWRAQGQVVTWTKVSDRLAEMQSLLESAAPSDE
jgi:hypothetical protein